MHLGPVSCRRWKTIAPMPMNASVGQKRLGPSVSARYSYRWLRRGSKPQLYTTRRIATRQRRPRFVLTAVKIPVRAYRPPQLAASSFFLSGSNGLLACSALINRSTASASANTADTCKEAS
jgi:hypothetical protein